MNKKQLAVLATCLLLFSLGLATAADTGTIGLNVTIKQVAVDVTPTTYAFGTLDLSTLANTSDVSPNYFTANNTGNVDEDFSIKGANMTDFAAGGSNTWVLNETEIGADQYMMLNSTDGGVTWNAIGLDFKTFATNIAAGNNQTFDLQLATPSSTSSYLEHNTTVTVYAVAS
ncbi:MAG: hypothetical protein JRD89_13620 [Deltaproteobacteria bacterium]|nr:hypothetical protein [Deltaproteobacteria bacterium]